MRKTVGGDLATVRRRCAGVQKVGRSGGEAEQAHRVRLVRGDRDALVLTRPLSLTAPQNHQDHAERVVVTAPSQLTATPEGQLNVCCRTGAARCSAEANWPVRLTLRRTAP